MSISFVFSRTTDTLIAVGERARYASVTEASRALSDGTASLITGAFGFDPVGTAALIAPAEVRIGARPTGSTVRPRIISRTGTSATVHADRVRAALAAIDSGRVQKAVLARTLELEFDGPIDPISLVGAFEVDERSVAFAVPLDAAPGHEDAWLVGASPELLIRRVGDTVTCHPFAGSAPRRSNPTADTCARESLLASDKDRREHAFVVDAIVEALHPLCADLQVPAEPTIESTSAVWHLATPIVGTLADPSITALDLAAALSPTPAVCGTPRTAAAELIAEIEGPRDFYAGAVGWADASGDGEWMVSIRCLELAADRTRVTTWAGGGIVAGSDPDVEVAETEAKFRTVLRALGQ